MAHLESFDYVDSSTDDDMNGVWSSIGKAMDKMSGVDLTRIDGYQYQYRVENYCGNRDRHES